MLAQRLFFPENTMGLSYNGPFGTFKKSENFRIVPKKHFGLPFI